MKKALIASTVLAMTAGVAAADVTISGYGRTGVIYYENADDNAGENESRVVSRLRMNLDASTSTDQGVDFGARFRLQWDQGYGLANYTSDPGGAQGIPALRGLSGSTNAGKLWVTSNGFTVEVGNVDTAFDSNGLIYETELGSYDRSVGFSDMTGDFFSYNTGPYAIQHIDRQGVRVLYSIDNLTVQASYVDPDQSGLIDEQFMEENDLAFNMEEEISLSIDYTWNERLELSAAYANNGAGIDNNDIFFVGARYAVLDNARIGLNYVDTNDEDDSEYGGVGQTFALFGDYTLADGLTNIEAYIANNNRDSNETDNAFGIGVNYDLGGARLGASLQRDYDELVTADFGVRFDF